MPSAPATTRVFVSFDYDHDEDLKILLVGQSRKHDTPFAFEDWSIKRATKDGRRTRANASVDVRWLSSSAGRTLTPPSA
jgi:hypothetical protein